MNTSLNAVYDVKVEECEQGAIDVSVHTDVLAQPIHLSLDGNAEFRAAMLVAKRVRIRGLAPQIGSCESNPMCHRWMASVHEGNCIVIS